eukprot:12547276-Alexandrium_andersonii.AAC.1
MGALRRSFPRSGGLPAPLLPGVGVVWGVRTAPRCPVAAGWAAAIVAALSGRFAGPPQMREKLDSTFAVSYTHLTLPTICSV